VTIEEKAMPMPDVRGYSRAGRGRHNSDDGMNTLGREHFPSGLDRSEVFGKRFLELGYSSSFHESNIVTSIRPVKSAIVQEKAGHHPTLPL
jgi:hypothetical protein